MKAKHLIMLIALIIPAFAAGPAQSGQDLRSRLDKGEIIVKTKKVKGFDVPEATMTAVIDAPPADIWKIISECNNYTKTMIRTLESEQVSTQGNSVVCRVLVDLPWPLSNLEAKTRAKHVVGPPVWSRTWSLISGDYESNKGSWNIRSFNPEGTRSLVIYKVHAVPDTAVPDSLIVKAQNDTLPKLIKHLRKSLKKKK